MGVLSFQKTPFSVFREQGHRPAQQLLQILPVHSNSLISEDFLYIHVLAFQFAREKSFLDIQANGLDDL